ncbi:MAG: ABC transporter permease subunit [Armatimonadota bacterium]|nr:ABC transporter permease subunit [Armatimonadota bacterium]
MGEGSGSIGISPGRPRGRRRARIGAPADLLAVVLLAAFVLATLVGPAGALVWNSLRAEGSLSPGIYARILRSPNLRQAVVTSLALAATAATVGTTLGALLALALHGTVGDRFRSTFLSLATVANNYGGVPLAFGFILLLGSTGMITLLVSTVLGRRVEIELVSFWGLIAVYLYFLIPLCVLTFLPSLAALRAELREAAEVHGARAYHFWRYIGGPILMPPLLASFVLLFASALGSYSTPWAIIGGGAGLTLMTVQIGFIFGESGFDIAVADGLAVMIIGLASASLVAYHALMSRAARWMR